MSLALSPLDGQVELRGLLGEGGMGEVHRAWDARLERAVAVKFVRGQDARDAERLLLEARLQARVEHRHVVRVHEVGTLAGRPCIVLQLVEGRTLAELAPGLSLPAKVELVRQAAEGLHAAHLQGLVHRDVKPANVLVEVGEGGARTAFVTDFGLARGEEPGLTRTGLPPGTLDYMSPEQLVGSGPVDFRSDVYALGATLYAVLGGRAPFRGAAGSLVADHPDATQVLRRILEAEPEPLARVSRGLPPELAVIAAKAMEKDPAARYSSAEAVAEELGRFQRGEPIRARPPTHYERMVKWARRNRTAARALLAAVLALALAGGWTLYSARRAGLEALEAARLGALAESMEAQLRMEYLSPPHDLRPALAEIRAEVERLRPVASRGDGPASFALGKGLELIGDVDGARGAYERAWARGFRTSRVAEGLGTVLGILYRQRYERARATLEPKALAEQVALIRREFRDPAAHYLALGAATGWRGPFLQASIALLEGDFPAARKSAQEALAADPGRYEASELVAEAWLEETYQLSMVQRMDDAETTLARVAEPLEDALRFGRSDPRPAKARIRMHSLKADLMLKRGKHPDAELAAVVEAVDQARPLNPDDPTLLVWRADALTQQAMYAFMAGPAKVMPLLEEANLLYRRAAELDGGELRTLCNHARCLYYKAFKLNDDGLPSLSVVEEGLALLKRAAARWPEEPRVPFEECMLHYVEADALRASGKPGAPALRQSVETGEEALRRSGAQGSMLRPIIGDALVLLAKDAWKGGGDPRPDLRRALAVMEEESRAQPGQPAVAGQVAFAHQTAAEILAASGEDIHPLLERGVGALDAVLAQNPSLNALQAIRGELLTMDAAQMAAAGVDPTAVAAEAGKSLEKAGDAGGDDLAIEEARAQLPLAVAHWKVLQGKDPSDLLARAEGHLAGLVKRHPQDAVVRALLAACAEQRARWLLVRGLPAASPAREGLAHLAPALEKEPNDPALWVLQASLEALAGDKEEARRSLDHAWAVNPLVRGGRESKEAEAALLP